MNGKIITFYSFKGGVGRTMALANVAFLAALNGKRVLIMDWDLEAPGLSYYFRGTLDGHDAKSIKEAPGILDLLWRWSYEVEQSSEVDSFEETVSVFQKGTIFEDCTRTVLSGDILPQGAVLDYIGAGTRPHGAFSGIAYEDALAKFSWPRFFDEYGGGLFLDSLRAWCKLNYDLILIDSRTGMADVAGICTIQLPDTVALCFVLNRQNIDGVAEISSAIRSRRGNEVALRVVPMRVARQDTSEESDARARALTELQRIGGFTPESVNDDFRSLSIPVADNVPFYETLAPIAASDPKFDVLTLKYVKLTEELADLDAQVPDLPAYWVELVRRRLQPRHATIDYVNKLKTAEPTRAAAEIENLIESVAGAYADDRSLDEAYILALLEAAFTLDSTALESTERNGDNFHERVLQLLRSLANQSPTVWRRYLQIALEKRIEAFDVLWDDERELQLLDELNKVLAEDPSLRAKLNRMRYRLRGARMLLAARKFAEAKIAVLDVHEMLPDLMSQSASFDDGMLAEFWSCKINATLLTGQLEEAARDNQSAIDLYHQAIADIQEHQHILLARERKRILQQSFILLSGCLEKVGNVVESAKYGIAAIEATTGIRGGVDWFSHVAKLVLKANDRELALDFCNAYFSTQQRRPFPMSLGSSARRARMVLQTLSEISGLIALISDDGIDNESTQQAVINLGNLARELATNMQRRYEEVEPQVVVMLNQRLGEVERAIRLTGMNYESLPVIGFPAMSDSAMSDTNEDDDKLND